MWPFGTSKKKERLLKLQSIVLKDAPSNRLLMSEKQLISELERMAQRELDIVHDCTRILQKTKDPDTFFMRLNLLGEKAMNLCTYAEYIEFSGAATEIVYKSYCEERQELIHQFLSRCYSDARYKEIDAKTTRGKIGKYQKYIDKFQLYYDQMDDNNRKYINTVFISSVDQLKAESE